jgi:Xaa-Pro aminopeptidase
MTEVLAQAQSDWTEFQLAGASSNALWSRGIHPALILAGGAKRSIQYRHPFPSAEPLGRFAMLVFCARRHGLFANLTRFLFFEEPTFQERALFEALAKVESAVLSATQVGNTLGQCYDALVAGYQAIGFAGEQNHHHQGGMTGYLSREIVALPDMQIPIENSSAFAWNPSLPGIKREDTLLLTQKGIEFLTVDPQWPTSVVEGRLRPDFWVKK